MPLHTNSTTISNRLRLHILRLAAHFGPIGRTQLPIAPPQSVLLIRPDHIGDVLFTGPAVRLLRMAWPKTRIIMLTGPWAAPVARGLPQVDEVISLPFPWFSRQPRHSFLQPYAQLLREAKRLSAHQFEVALILRFDHWWGAWLAQRARILHRIGYNRPEVAPFLTQALPYEPNRHEVLQNLRLVEALVGQAADAHAPLSFEPAPDAQKTAEALLHAAGVEMSARLACIHPGAGATTKLWANVRWAAIIEALVCQGFRVCVTGGVGEVDLVNDLIGQTSAPVINLAGRMTLDQLAAVLSRCQIVIGTDSGPLHLAVAMGTPTVHLYGPVDTRTFGPWGNPTRHAVVRAKRACVPCNRLDYCAVSGRLGACMLDITIEQVLEAMQQVLRSGNSTPDSHVPRKAGPHL